MDKNKKKTLVIFGLLCGLIISIILYMIFGGGTETSGDDRIIGSNIKQELPDGIPEIMPDTKSASYKDKRTISTEEYFNMLAHNDSDICLVSEEQSEKENSIEIQDKESAAKRVFGPVSEKQNNFPEKDKSYSSFRSETIPRMAPEEKLEYDRKRAEMVKDVLIGSENTNIGCGTVETVHIEKPDKLLIDFDVAADDRIISSLDDINNDSGSSEMQGIRRSFKCMFVKNQKIHDGERIRVRLLEDYIADGISIPANTHLTAICRIGKRLELSVLSMQMNGIIVPVSMEAYDTDGLPGIYCPETISSKSATQASNDAISAAGSTFGGLVGDIANTIIRTGANLARSANGKVSVNVVSGYEFFLVKNDKIR